MGQPLQYSRFFTAWRGLGLPYWMRLLRQRPPMDWSSLGQICSLTCTSILNSTLNVAEQLVCGSRYQQVALDERPVFILGHWRSGTSLLHYLLALDPQFAYVNTYQAMFPSHFLLTERWATRLLSRLIPSKRPMDNMEAGWRLPQEDELALHSPYLADAFPGNDQKAFQYMQLSSALSSREMARWQQALILLMKKVAWRQNRSRFVLKSPNHTSRIPILLKLFPQTKFVYLVRNPYDVFASTLKLRKSMRQLNSFSRRWVGNLEQQILNAYRYLYFAYQSHKRLLQPDQLIEVRFEDLVADPISTSADIYRKLGIEGFGQALPGMTEWVEAHRDYRPESYTLTPEIRAKINEQWGPAFVKYQYEKS